MATCKAGGRCKIECTGGCSCVYVDETDTCTCECYDDVGGSSGQRFTLGNKINVSVAGLPLGQVAAQLDRLLVRDVLVPASRTREKVRLTLTSVTFSAALKRLGLRTQRPLGGRGGRRTRQTLRARPRRPSNLRAR